MQTKEINIGIDFSKQRADIGMFDEEGKALISHQPLGNTYTGYKEFKKLVVETARQTRAEKINISGEATSLYWMPFFLEIARDKELQAMNTKQYLLNPRMVKWFKKSLPPDHKTDAKDAQIIAERTRVMRPAYTWQADHEWLRLRSYMRLRFHLVQVLTREKNYFQAYLFVLNNAYAQFRPFSDLFGASSSRFLKQMGLLDEITGLDSLEALQELQKNSKAKLPDPLQNLRILHKVTAERFVIDDDLAEALQEVLNLVLAHIEFIAEQVKQINGIIKTEAKKHAEVAVMRTVPGIGLVFSSGICSEIGNLDRYLQGEKWDRKRECYRHKNLRDAENSIAKISGMWWPRVASGDFEAEDRNLSKSGNRYLRYYLIEAADRLRQYVPAYAKYYQKKYAEVNRHRHKRALVLTARKSIGLYVGLLHRKEAFRFEESLN